MTLRTQQALLVILALSAALVGGWATADPHSFYASFPGAGHHWVAMDGPYNEHLVRDVGSLNLSLVVLVFTALLIGTRLMARRVQHAQTYPGARLAGRGRRRTAGSIPAITSSFRTK